MSDKQQAGALGTTARVEATFEQAVEQTKAALKQQGFGVLSEIRIDQALKEKLGVEMPKQLILGACNPQLAYAALELEPDLALLLPCNVVVSERHGRVEVSAVNAEQMLEVVGRDELRAIAEDANRRLRAAIESLRGRKAA
jgi:uncharacterized protein (DUF302 family)